MPRSSSSLISEASVKRGGGCVKCCSGSALSGRRVSPFSSGGRRTPSPSASLVSSGRLSSSADSL